MNIFYKGMCALLVSITIVACSKDNETTEDLNTFEFNEQAGFTSKAPAINYHEATKALNDEMKGDFPKLPLSQGDLEHYGAVVKYGGGLNASDASRVIDEISYSQEVGIRTYVQERTQYSTYTKETIVLIVENGPIKDLEDSAQFADLSKSEQDVLVEVNKIASDYSNGMLAGKFQGGCTINGEPAPCDFVGAVAGATVGFMAGNALCGIPCGVGGAILGGIIGWAIGGGEK